MTIDKSSIDITKLPKPTVIIGSEEDYYLAEDAATRIKRVSRISGLQDGTGAGLLPDDSKFNDRPELSDIESIVQTIYYDSKQKKKFTKLTIRIRNSSGKKLLGIDARTTIPVSSGGQA
jgi:hypothetical protein